MKQVLPLFMTMMVIAAYSQNNFNANIKDLAFMSGKWTVQHEWGDMEENWGEPMGDNMICSYRCVKNGKIIFYEFIVIEQSDSVPVMKLRHFSPGSIGWEEKDKPHAYPLVSLTSNTAVFERPDKKLRMTFFRISPQQLSVRLEKEDKNGKWTKDEFAYSFKS